jgi:Coenzyme PQQ synthesis protein D (PqqD)
MTAEPREISPDAIGPDFTPQRGTAVHTVEIDGEAVLLDEGHLHLLNATGSLVWACFDGTGTIAEIATDISEGLGAHYEAVLDDTLAIARQLGGEGLLESVTPNTDEVDPAPATPPSKWSSDPRFVDEPPNT